MNVQKLTKKQLFDALRQITEDQLVEAFNTICFEKILTIYEIAEERISK